jgi:hypothetical protein
MATEMVAAEYSSGKGTQELKEFFVVHLILILLFQPDYAHRVEIGFSTLLVETGC